MNIIISLFFCLIAAILSYIIFGIIFYGLNNSMLMIFVPLQSFIFKIKKKELARVILEALSIGICVSLQSYFHFNYIIFGILIGAFKSLVDIIFLKGIIAKKADRN